MFYATTFTYNGVSCKDFDLTLCASDKGLMKNDNAIGSVNYVTDKTSSMNYNYLLGAQQNDVLEFEITMMTNLEKDREWVGQVMNWLTGYNEYKKLTFDQPDMEGIYFNCIVEDVKLVTVGNMPKGFTCKIKCDRGYALEEEKVYTYNISSSPHTFTHTNTSHGHGVTLPVVEVTTSSSNATVSIVNASNNNWETKLTGLTSNEVITMDSQHEIIKSSNGVRRLANFNNHWFELVEGDNRITVTGNVSKIVIRYKNNRKVGV